MEYEPDFHQCFLNRTLALVHEYKGAHEATLLVNCLLGLLVLPKEVILAKNSYEHFPSIEKMGIRASSIINAGNNKNQPKPKELIRRLRNAVAHFRIEPIHKNGEIEGYTFKDNNEFHANLSLTEIRELIISISGHPMNLNQSHTQ